MAELHLNGDSSGFLEIQPPENGPNRILVAPNTQGSGLNTFRISEADNDLLVWDTAVAELNIGSGLSGGFITYSGTIQLIPATLTDIGGVIPVGDNFTIAPSGNLNLSTTSVVSGSYNSASIRVDEYGRIYEAVDGPSGIIRTITTSQQITGGGSTDLVNIGHANSGATAGSYNFPTLTVDAQGHITDVDSNTAVQFVRAGTALQVEGSTNPITSSGNIGLADTAVTPGTYNFATITVDQQGRLTAASTGTLPPESSGTVETINTAVGIQGGPITQSGTLTLANTAVTPGTYNFATITVDQQGRLTAASTGSLPPATSGTVEVINTAVGINGGPITESGTITLANTAVTPGTYNFATITVDQQGRLTAASTGSLPPATSGTVETINTAVGIQGGPITESGTLTLTNTAVTPGSYDFASITVDQQGRLTAASTGSLPAIASGTVTTVNTANGIQGGPITESGTVSLTNTGVTPATYNFATVTVDAQGRITSASTGTPPAGTVTSVGTGTGLTGGPITTAGTISLANTAVTPGSYTSANITVDAQGRLTAAADGGGGDITAVTAGSGLVGGGTTGAVRLDVVSNSDGLVVNNNNIVLNTSVGIEVAEGSGLAVSLTANPGLEFTGGNLRVADGDGLNRVGGSLVAQAGSGIVVASNGISAQAGSGIVVDNNGIAINVAGGDGITFDGDTIAVDGSVVRTAGAQTISGQKTFTTQVTVLDSQLNIQAAPASAGTPSITSPNIQLRGSYWDGAASQTTAGNIRAVPIESGGVYSGEFEMQFRRGVTTMFYIDTDARRLIANGPGVFEGPLDGNATTATNIFPGQNDALNLQAGNNANRPGSPSAGNLRWNTQANNPLGRRLEVYDGGPGAWRQLEFASFTTTFPDFTATLNQTLPPSIFCNNCTIAVNVFVEGSCTIYAQGNVTISANVTGTGRGPIGAKGGSTTIPGNNTTLVGRPGTGMGGNPGQDIANPISFGLGSNSGGGACGAVSNNGTTSVSIPQGDAGDGGAVFLVRALGDISSTGGTIAMQGSNALTGGGIPASTARGGNGGGAGGIICFDGDGSVTLSSTLNVFGGNGSNGTSNGGTGAAGGGGGGGGAIFAISRSSTLTLTSTTQVQAGSNGSSTGGTGIAGGGGGACFGRGGSVANPPQGGFVFQNATLFF